MNVIYILQKMERMEGSVHANSSYEIPWEKLEVLADPIVRKIICHLQDNMKRWTDTQEKMAEKIGRPVSTLNKKLHEMEKVGLVEIQGDKLIKLLNFEIPALNPDVIYRDEKRKRK